MKRLLQAKYSVSFIVIILLLIGFNWVTTEKAISFSEPSEAVLSLDQDLWLIPAKKINNGSLYFFINDKKDLGVTFLHEGIFGWKLGEIKHSLIDVKKDYQNLDHYQVYDNFLVYGLTKNIGDAGIKVNGEEAVILNLQMLDPADVEKYDLDDMYIWYFESDIPLIDGKIESFDRATGEIITTSSFKVRE